MLTRHIGLIGPAGAGKSTVARVIANSLGAAVLPFAAPLKDMLAALGVPSRALYGSPADKTAPLDMLGGRSARWAMQTLGTEWGRNMVDERLWVRAWQNRARQSNARIIADDVRFTQEADAIRALGGVIIAVVRSEADFYTSMAGVHASETGYLTIQPDAVIVNAYISPEASDAGLRRLADKIAQALLKAGALPVKAA